MDVILDDILESKRRELERLRGRERELAALADEAPPPRGFAAAIRDEDAVSVIAEFKRRSPSAGPIDPYARVATVVTAYEEDGAAAVSVLTDGPFFAGSPADLAEAREACRLPLLRKDFVIDPVQVLESRAAGADAVLLIVRALDDGLLRELLSECRQLGMAALVEVHEPEDLDRALAAGAEVVGINARDLASFEVDVDAALELLGRVPGDVVAVAESGVRGPEDVRRAGRAGADAVLVGSWLMRGEQQAGVAALTGHRRIPRPQAAPVAEE